MARKPKAPRTEKTEPVKPNEARAVITEKKLRSLMKSARSAQNDISEIAGGLGSEIKTAVETHHLHRKAFGVIKAADRMEPEKLADFLDNLAYYLDISGMNERAAKVQRMQFGPGKSTEESEEPAEDPAPAQVARGNVRAFPAPAGVAAE